MVNMSNQIQQTSIALQTYTKKERNMYLIGMAGQNMIYSIIGTGLVYYFQSVIFLPAIAISIIFFVARVWDAINDPMMGTICDKTRTKWGKCRPYLMFAPPVIMVITILTFLNATYSDALPTSEKALIIIWAGVSYIMWGMSYTSGDIPLWGIMPLMTEVEKDREKILALARIFGAIGAGPITVLFIPVAQAISKKMVENGTESTLAMKHAFIYVAIVCTVIASVLFELAGLFSKERVRSSEKHYTIKQNFMLMWNNKPYRRIMLSGIIRAPMSLLTVVAMTLISYYFGNNGNKPYIDKLLILGGPIFLAMFVASALVPKLTEKHSKTKLFIFFNIISGIPFLLLYVCYKIAPTSLDQPLWLGVLLVIFALCGAGMGGVNVLQAVMISDTIDYEEYYHGVRPDGVFFSGQSFVVKLSAGIASILQGIVFAAVGFSGSNVEKVNKALSAGAQFKTAYPKYAGAMFLLCSIPSAIGVLLSVLPMRKYELTDDEHTRILGQLNRRRHGEECDVTPVPAFPEMENFEKASTSDEQNTTVNHTEK